MSTSAPPLDAPESGSAPSIEQLDEAIRRFASEMNIINHRMLVLVREFDERLGWAKWSFSSCAEWLHWRIGIGLSAAREKVRVAHALVDLPAIAQAFEKGSLSYSKVRALTRAADAANEQVLLEYALRATSPQVEERCRQIRNAGRDSTDEARKVWARRSLSLHRNPARNTITIHVELPRETGELVAIALDKAAQSADTQPEPEFAGEGWHAQQADALVAIAETYLSGAVEGAARTRADHHQVVVHVDEAAPWRDRALGPADRDGEAARLRLDALGRDQERWRRAARRWPAATYRAVEAAAGLMVARPRLHVPGLLQHPLPRCASRTALGQRRRDERREYRAALLASSSARARGRVSNAPSGGRHIRIPPAGRADDSCLRLSGRGRGA